jgi:hypothetical protein
LPEVGMDENTLTRTVRDLQNEIHSLRMDLQKKN